MHSQCTPSSHLATLSCPSCHDDTRWHRSSFRNIWQLQSFQTRLIRRRHSLDACSSNSLASPNSITCSPGPLFGVSPSNSYYYCPTGNLNKRYRRFVLQLRWKSPHHWCRSPIEIASSPSGGATHMCPNFFRTTASSLTVSPPLLHCVPKMLGSALASPCLQIRCSPVLHWAH